MEFFEGIEDFDDGGRRGKIGDVDVGFHGRMGKSLDRIKKAWCVERGLVRGSWGLSSFLECLPGLPGKKAEEDGKEKAAEVLIENHSSDERNHDGDPESGADALWAKEGAEHLSAIEREDGEEVEDGPEDADAGEDHEEVKHVGIEVAQNPLGENHPVPRPRQDGVLVGVDVAMCEKKEKYDHAQGDLNGGTGGGDEEALGSSHAHAVVAGIAAEGLQDDFRACAEASGGEGVAEFVNQDGDEPGKDKQARVENEQGRIGAKSSADQSEGNPEEWLNVDGDAEKREVNHDAAPLSPVSCQGKSC